MQTVSKRSGTMAKNIEEGMLTTPPTRGRGRSGSREEVAGTSSGGRPKSAATDPSQTSAVRSGRGEALGAQGGSGGGLRKDLRDFAAARPQGWSHDDWLVFLEGLKSRGYDVADRDAIGLALEKERLDLTLSKTKGIGPQRRQTLVDRYGTLWNLRNADATEIASTARIPRTLAESLKSELLEGASQS
jgi:hypothetical protein